MKKQTRSVIQIRLEPELKQDVLYMCEATNQNISEIIREHLKRRVKRYQEKGK